MRIQLLVATMMQEDHSLLDKMNIQTDAIICNQGEHNKFEHFLWNGHQIDWLSFHERGVGLNRNNALMRADADIVLFADDDMVYEDGYADLVRRAYERLPDADIIIFNLKNRGDQRTITDQDRRVTWHNYMRYGAAQCSARLNKIRLNGISFNLCFGGGAKYSYGEDTLFLTQCLKAGLKIYHAQDFIAELKEERESTWFEGYTDQFFRDKGLLYRIISRKFWRLLCIQDAVRHRRLYERKWTESLKPMIAGGKMYTDL